MTDPNVNLTLQELQAALVRIQTAKIACDYEPGMNTDVIQTLNLVASIERMLEEKGKDCTGYLPE